MKAKSSVQESSTSTVSGPALKFIIGFVAGWCAACFPRLAALLAGTGAEDGLSLFTFEYVMLSVVFSIVIGFVVMIMEWQVAREPKATFMMAIGIPALLTGSFNATNGATQVAAQQEKIVQLTTELKNSADISISSQGLGSYEVLDDLGPQSHSDYLQWLGIKSAHAADAAQQKQETFNPGYKIEEPLYYLSLGTTTDKQEALTMLRQLRLKVSTATAVKTENGYTILGQLQPMPKSAAVIEASKLKQQEINVSLVPVKSRPVQ